MNTFHSHKNTMCSAFSLEQGALVLNLYPTHMKHSYMNHSFLKITMIFLTLLFTTMQVQSQSWTQIGADIDGEAADDWSGWSVSLSSDGHTLAIGAPFNDANGSSAGQVRVYQNVSGTWTQIGDDIDGEAAGDRSGDSVSLSSDGATLAIGARLNDGNGSDAGHVRVYQYVGGTWTQIGDDIDGEAVRDWSGRSVSLSSDGATLAIGAIWNDGNGFSAGHVRVYQYVGGSWTQIGADIDGEAAYDESGSSVSLSSDGAILAIGAQQNDGNGTSAGHVRVYQNVSGTWTQIGADIDGEASGDDSGWSVSLSSDGATLAIGAISNDGNGSNSGHVRVYQNVSGTWTQIGADIDGEASGDDSGRSVSLSSDGATLAIGAPYNDGNGPNAGHVRVYQNVSGTWTQVGADIDGEAAVDVSGFSVSLSSDGATLAIGARNNDGNGTDAGHVRVYQIAPSAVHEASGLEDSFMVVQYAGQLSINNTANRNALLSIYDLQGRLLQSGIAIRNGHQFVDVNYPTQTLILRFESEGGFWSERIVLE